MSLLLRINFVRRLRNRRRNHLIIVRRNLRDSLNPYNVSEERFMELYRFPKQLAKDFFNGIAHRFQSSERITALSANIRFLCALRFFSSGCYQRSVGQDFMSSLSQSSVSRCVDEVADILNDISSRHVTFPRDEELSEIKRQFYQIAGFPGTVGLIDGTHIRIISPPNNIEHAYYCRKGGHSINVLIICDSNYIIRYVNSKFPGTSHDAYVWRRSAAQAYLKQKYVQGRHNNWLLGDSGFPLQPWLMTPITSACNQPEETYNIAHKKTRCVVERCIGVLKSRFRCLLGQRVLCYSPTKAGKIVNACVVLHNVLMKAKVPLHETILQADNEDLSHNPGLNVNEYNVTTQGRQTRQEIVNSNFTL